MEKAEKLTHIKSLFDNEMDVIAIKIFENPYFQDKVVVAEYKDEESNKTNKELGGPKTASFEQIYKGDLNLEFFLSSKDSSHLQDFQNSHSKVLLLIL